MRSGARFADKAMVLDALDRGEGDGNLDPAHRSGARLRTGCRGVFERVARARKRDFSLERAAFLTVLHRLFCGGSDRAPDHWREDYRIDERAQPGQPGSLRRSPKFWCLAGRTAGLTWPRVF